MVLVTIFGLFAINNAFALTQAQEAAGKNFGHGSDYGECLEIVAITIITFYNGVVVNQKVCVIVNAEKLIQITSIKIIRRMKL